MTFRLGKELYYEHGWNSHVRQWVWYCKSNVAPCGRAITQLRGGIPVERASLNGAQERSGRQWCWKGSFNRRQWDDLNYTSGQLRNFTVFEFRICIRKLAVHSTSKNKLMVCLWHLIEMRSADDAAFSNYCNGFYELILLWILLLDLSYSRCNTNLATQWLQRKQEFCTQTKEREGVFYCASRKAHRASSIDYNLLCIDEVIDESRVRSERSALAGRI